MSHGASPVFITMSALTRQPVPFGRLEREKHIQMIFRAFQNPCGMACECRGEPACQSRRDPGPDLALKEERPGGTLERSVEGRGQLEEQKHRTGAASLRFLSQLEGAGRIHVTARPNLQGPQCVSRRIYSISTGGSGSQMSVAVEESSCVCLQCCGPARACSLQGFDCQGHPIFYFERPLRVDACCFGCCLMEIRAYSPQRRLIGTVRQRWSMFTPLLEACDPEGASAARIQGPCCPWRCRSNQRFQIVSNVGEEMGTIWKKWPGFNEQRNMDHEYFGLDVPKTVDPHTKLLLLAATFLLNHMFFEMS